METIDCFIPYSDVETATGNVNQFRASGLTAHVFLLAKDTTLPPVDGCATLFIDTLESSATLRQMAQAATADYVAIYSKHTPLDLGYRALERAVGIMEQNGAGMVYSDHYSVKDGKTEQACSIPYQTGSVRNDFDFGSLRIVRTSVLKAWAEEYRDREWKAAAMYELTLYTSRMQNGICYVNEFLYTELETDLRKSGEKQFDYVDPRNREVQVEMEQVCTGHLKRIGAYISPDGVTDVAVEEESFANEVSVIIPVRNRAKTIRDAIQSATSQETDFPFNVIVVDNHSDDGTTEIIDSLAAADPRVVHVVPTRGDLGIGGCWNLAVNRPECGRFAVQLDSDDLYARKDTLQMIVAVFRKEHCAMVIGSYLMCDFQLKELPPGVIDHREWTDGNGRNNALRINGLGAPRAFYTPLLRKVGVPNTCYGEDYALGLAFSRKYRIGRIYDVVYLCRRWDGNSDAALSPEKVNKNNYYKDFLRTAEIAARQRINRSSNGRATQEEANRLFDSQMQTWTEAAKRYADLRSVKTRELTVGNKTVTVQFNPSRIVSTGASIDKETVKHRPCFLCEDNRPDAQTGIVLNDRFLLLVNPYPILPRHFTIPLRQHKPQQIRPYFRDMLQIARSLTDMFIFYNGPLCGASAPDHMHFQAGPKESLKKGPYASRTIMARFNSLESACHTFNRIYDSLPLEEGETEPRMNVLAWTDDKDYVFVVFPRRKHRPDCYYSEGEERLLVSPGALDMMGLVITPREEDFNKITAEQAVGIIKECGV